MAPQRLTVCASHSPRSGLPAVVEEGPIYRSAIVDARRIIDRFDPDLVVVFGADHRRGFVGTVPAISVIASASGYGDYQTTEDAYSIPSDRALELARGLLEHDFDVAVSHDARLDHGFGRTVTDLLGGVTQHSLLPIFVNCSVAPLAPPRRAVALGHAVGSLLEGDERILFIGSGGLSHSPPSMGFDSSAMSEDDRKRFNQQHLAAAADLVRPEWDAEFLKNIASDDDAWLGRFDQQAIDPSGSGGNEVRTWLAARAAGGGPLATLGYEVVRPWITGMGVVASTWVCE